LKARLLYIVKRYLREREREREREIKRASERERESFLPSQFQQNFTNNHINSRNYKNKIIIPSRCGTCQEHQNSGVFRMENEVCTYRISLKPTWATGDTAKHT
jgi:formylmethanofuran dehydrogenase subunit E